MTLEPQPAPNRPRVLFVLNSALGHVTVHLRGRLFGPLLLRDGWQVSFIDVQEQNAAAVLEAARHADIVYLLKIASLALIEDLKRHTSARIVFDLTDSLWHPVHQAAGWHDLDTILSLVDEIYSENEWICAYGRKFTPLVTSIPACTQIEKFDYLRQTLTRPTGADVVIGWIGSISTVGAMRFMHPILERLGRRHPNLQFRVLGAALSQLPPFKHVRITAQARYDEDMMLREILTGMDIGIFPPALDEADYAVRGGLKAFLYMSGGLPAVCLRGGDPERIITDGVNGMLCGGEAEWEAKLERLIGDPQLRRSMGHAGIDLMRKEHSLEHVYKTLRSAFIATHERRLATGSTNEEPRQSPQHFAVPAARR